MKRLSNLKFIVLILLLWRASLFLLAWMGEKILLFEPRFPYSEIYLIPSKLPFWIWSFANFDGVHYLSIAQKGYQYQFTQTFFPFFPMLTRWLAPIFGGNFLISSFAIVHLSLIIALLLFWFLLRLNFKESIARWTLLFLLFFPTGFYLGSVYTESLFLVFVLGAFWAAKKGKWWLAGILGGLGSSTRLVGIFLLPSLLWEWWEQKKLKTQNSKLILRQAQDDAKRSRSIKVTAQSVKLSDNSSIWKLENLQFLWLFLIPIGLLGYMFYLGKNFGDPLYFLHAQPAFGAERSGGQIILLPQVYFRYLKMFFTVSYKNYAFWIALLEFMTFNLVLFLLWQGYTKNLPRSWLIFSLLAVVAPTLTGTLSSIPRYVLAAFPIFIVPSLWKSKRSKMILFTIYYLLFTILTILFTRGHWVS